MRILVVDDEELLRRSLASYLTFKGHIAYPAASGVEAERALDRGRFDAAIVDIQLGGVDGITHALIMQTMQPDLRCALVSGDTTNLMRAREAGFDRLFLKPLVPDVIEKILAELKR